MPLDGAKGSAGDTRGCMVTAWTAAVYDCMAGTCESAKVAMRARSSNAGTPRAGNAIWS
jgi:hypothetical protein